VRLKEKNNGTLGYYKATLTKCRIAWFRFIEIVDFVFGIGQAQTVKNGDKMILGGSCEFSKFVA
tara:strand:+ start:622 stop:813 length:192 start_codon:yes stop_codon:yes gene_type:complete